MKTIVEEVSGEGLESLLGKEVLVFCAIYIYTGILIGVNDSCIKLRGSKIVYETGSFDEPEFSNAQSLTCDIWYVNQSMIESFGVCHASNP